MRSCKETAELIAGDRLCEEGWVGRLLVRLHLLMCRHCREYAAQLRTIGSVSKDVVGGGNEDSDSLERLRSSLLDRARTAAPPKEGD